MIGTSSKVHAQNMTAGIYGSFHSAKTVPWDRSGMKDATTRK